MAEIRSDEEGYIVIHVDEGEYAHPITNEVIDELYEDFLEKVAIGDSTLTKTFYDCPAPIMEGLRDERGCSDGEIFTAVIKFSTELLPPDGETSYWDCNRLKNLTVFMKKRVFDADWKVWLESKPDWKWLLCFQAVIHVRR